VSKKPKTIEELVDKCFDELFDFVVEVTEDDLYDISIEVRTKASGKTITRSWQEREYRLQEEQKDD